MATNPTLITTPFAESGDKTTPPNTNTPSDGRFSQTLGFPPVTAIPLGSGGKAPKREDFNGAFNMLSNIAFYAQKGWIFQWDSGQTYYAGCIVRYSGDLYACTSDVTSTTAPSSDTSHWSKYNISPGTTYAPINSPTFTGVPKAPTASAGTNTTQLATTAFVQNAISGISGVPVGFILPFAGTGSVAGFLDCDGSAVSRSTYSSLFSAIGTTWGAGNGSTTFNLPRSADLVMQGASTTNPVGTYKTAGLPNIEGKFGLYDGAGATSLNPIPGASNLFYITNGGNAIIIQDLSSPQKSYDIFNLDASRVSSIYGNSSTVQPPAACVKFMIKY